MSATAQPIHRTPSERIGVCLYICQHLSQCPQRWYACLSIAGKCRTTSPITLVLTRPITTATPSHTRPPSPPILLTLFSTQYALSFMARRYLLALSDRQTRRPNTNPTRIVDSSDEFILILPLCFVPLSEHSTFYLHNVPIPLIVH